MRADMFKVIVERPRLGRAWAQPIKLKRSRDQGIKFIGLKRHLHIHPVRQKGFNENLRPLVRFLRARRGCRWDDVFSEICAHLDTGSTVKMHVRMHLKDFVMFGIARGRHGEWMHDGRVIVRERVRWRRFFVDPDDGVLKDIALLWPRVEPGDAQ
ncbi:MAG: hypothetical protein V4574_01460 [Pseudomonadota bacterium]